MLGLVFLFLFANADALTQASCLNSSDFLYYGPMVHGKVEKKAVLPPEYWWNVTHLSFYKNMKKFMADQKLTLDKNTILQDNQVPKYPIKLPISERCQIFISHQYKLIYIKLPKTAGNSLRGIFVKRCQKFNGSDEKECINANFIRANLEDIPDRRTAINMWKDYFVFTTVRNPYARGASAYAYLLKRRAKNNESDPECSNWPSFQQFCKAPFVIGLQSETYKCIDFKTHDYVHVEPQIPCIANEYGEYFVDFILSLENIADDFADFKQELLNYPGMNETQKAYFQKISELQFGHVNAVASNSSYASGLFHHCEQACVQSLADYYKDDFKVLGYRSCVYGF